jgi:hypothetical protein
MSTTPKNSLLLALVLGSLVGPAAAAAKPVYDPGEVPLTRSQTQATPNANRPAASYYSAQALRAMGARGQAQSEFYATPSVDSPVGQATEATGDRWGADAYAKSPSASYHAGQILNATGDRWAARGAFNKSESMASHSAQNAARSKSATSGDSGSNVLAYILGALAVLLAGMAVLVGISRRVHTDSKARIALP